MSESQPDPNDQASEKKDEQEQPSSEELIDRRSLLGVLTRSAGTAIGLTTGIVATVASGLVVGVGLLAYICEPMFRGKQNGWADAGNIDDFRVHHTTLVNLMNPVRQPWDGAAGKIAIYVRRLAEQKFLVLNVNCTHLGCPVSWFPQSGLFMCPCHGGINHEDGSRAAGPPPRGLFHLKHRIVNHHLHVFLGHFPTLQEADTSSYEPEERFHYHP